jgi:AcrR family transcriptional regulator
MRASRGNASEPPGAGHSDRARERILDAAYRLFSRDGVQAVGIDTVIAEADVAKATLYHHFPSKEALIIAFLALREERWTYGWLQAEAERRAAIPADRALAVLDALDEWFHRPDYEGCSFLNTLLEISDRDNPVYAATVRHLSTIERVLETYAEQAGASNAPEAAYQLQTILMGAIVSASRGDQDAARRIRPLVASMLAGSA